MRRGLAPYSIFEKFYILRMSYRMVDITVLYACSSFYILRHCIYIGGEMKRIIAAILWCVLLQMNLASASHVDPDDDPFLGNNDSIVTLIEFGGFQEYFSRRFWNDTLPLIKTNFINTGMVKYVFRDFPLSAIHLYAQKSAEASECADEQGKYWLYHDYLFGNSTDWVSSPNLSVAIQKFKQYAIILGLNSTQFDTCLDTGQMYSEIQNYLNEGIVAGVSGSPYFFVQNICGTEQMIVGAQPYLAFAIALNNSFYSCAQVLTSCNQPITQSGKIYALVNNVNSSGTCFNIQANNVVLDCLGKTITYAMGSQGWA